MAELCGVVLLTNVKENRIIIYKIIIFSLKNETTGGKLRFFIPFEGRKDSQRHFSLSLTTSLDSTPTIYKIINQNMIIYLSTLIQNPKQHMYRYFYMFTLFIIILHDNLVIYTSLKNY